MAAPPPPRPESYAYNRESHQSYTRTVGGTGSADDEKSAYGFGMLALAQAGLAIPLLFQPRETARFLLGSTALPANAEHDRLMGMLAAGLLSGATTAWALKSSADARTLESDTSERLQLGLMGMAGAALGVHMLHGGDLTNNGKGTGVAAAALTFAVPAARMLGTDRGRRRLGSRIKGCCAGVGRLFDFRNGFKLSSALYAVVTPAFLVAGASYLISPQKTLSNLLGYVLKGNDSIFLWRNMGGALLTLLPAVTYSLKEKSDNNRLNDSTARTLNLGLFLTSLGHLVVLGPMANEGTGGRYLPVLVGTWATACAASLVGLSSGATNKAV